MKNQVTVVTDTFGDDLRLYESGGYIYLVGGAGDGGGDYEFDNEGAAQVRDALNDLLGVENGGEAVRASDVSLNEGLLRLAGVHNVPVTFRYAKGENQPIEARTFIPAQVKDKGDHVTFVGYDEDRGAVRSFRSDRIKGQVSL